jgi:cytochrome c5
VEKLIRKILSYKKTVTLVGILFLLGVAGAGFLGFKVYQNVGKMSAQNEVSRPYYPAYPAVNANGKDLALIQKGEYLAKAGDCIACHTNTTKQGPAFAGGLPMLTPFGTIYSPNLTPDQETGIGKWTDEQFIKAMREGISEHGKYYYPAFPYYFFNRISTDDLKAIKAYLDAIPAVKQKNTPNTMLWPFSWRFLQLGWRVLFFHSPAGEYAINPKQSDQWNRGAYLVKGLGHCAMCHTPSYNILTDALPLAAPIEKYDLTGAKIQGYLAPNITKSNLGSVPDAEVVSVFTEDKLIGGGKVAGPMLEVNHDSLHYLSTEDLTAISVYLKTVESQSPPKPKSTGGPGQALYESYCSGCHTMGSGGAPKFGDANNWDPLIKAGMPALYTNAIKGINGMPAKGTCIACSDDEIKQAVDYMVAAVSGSTSTMTKIPAAKKLTSADGLRIYNENCSVCHNTGFKNAPKPGDVQAWTPSVKAGFLSMFENVVIGKNGHPPRGTCVNCSDAELIAAIKYMLQQSAPGKDYSLW